MDLKVKTENIPEAKLKVIQKSSGHVETADFMPVLSQYALFCGKRNSGKSTKATQMLRMYKETGSIDRVLVISPTASSNRVLIDQLGINKEDIFSDPNEKGLIKRIIKVVEAERDDFVRYMDLRRNFKRIMKEIKLGLVPPDPEQFEDYMMAYYNSATDEFEMPAPKYDRWERGEPTVMALLIDDSMCSSLMTDRAFQAFTMRHRHIGELPWGGALGISVFICIQSYKSQGGGLPKCARNQATSITLFRTKDRSELNQIAEAFSGEIPVEKFLALYEYATAEDEHDSLFVDLHYKKGIQASPFRKNMDTYLIVDD